MGSDESHFNVSVGSDGQSHRTVSTNHNLFEIKGVEAVSNRGPSTYQPNALPLGQTSSHKEGQTDTFLKHPGGPTLHNTPVAPLSPSAGGVRSVRTQTYVAEIRTGTDIIRLVHRGPFGAVC